MCEQVLSLNVDPNFTGGVEICASDWLVTVVFILFDRFINFRFFNNVKNVLLL